MCKLMKRLLLIILLSNVLRLQLPLFSWRGTLAENSGSWYFNLCRGYLTGEGNILLYKGNLIDHRLKPDEIVVLNIWMDYTLEKLPWGEHYHLYLGLRKAHLMRILNPILHAGRNDASLTLSFCYIHSNWLHQGKWSHNSTQ